ncbi:MAG: hypothetical protein ABSG43_10090 [Solirubrobacteraceae bacterium]
MSSSHLGLAQGAGVAFAEQVGEPVALHMNVHIPRRLVGEAHLLHAAAHLDVAGTRAGDLPAQTRRAVVAACPQDGFPLLFAHSCNARQASAPDPARRRYGG